MKKVAIVGFAGSRTEAPYDDPSYEIWGLNDLYDCIPRFTRWFDIHDFDTGDPNSIKTHKTNRAKLQKLKAYQKMDCDIYCQEEWDLIPNSVKYPLELIEQTFCGGERGYFTNQVSYMIALAIYEEYDVIDIYGVDMALDSEYNEQRPSVEYWIGMARGKGIQVYIPRSSSLIKAMYRYGYEHEQASVFIEDCKQRLEYLKAQKEKAMGLTRQNEKAVDQYTGAIGDLEHTMKVWSGHV